MNILSMSGFIPEHICDTVRFTQYSGERNIASYCGYASDFISQVMGDKNIDGAVYPKSCDSSRIIGSYLDTCGKFLHQINVPAGTGPDAVLFFAEEIKRYQTQIEKHYHTAINNIGDRIALLNRRNRKICDLYDNLDTLDYLEYIENIHRNLKRPLCEQDMGDSLRRGHGTGKRVFVTGSFLSGIEIAGIIEDRGLKIVGDNLPESGRLCSLPETKVTGDIYCNISENIMGRRLSPTQDHFNRILEADIEEIKRKEIKGVIMVIQKYCEPYEYLYSIYKDRLETQNIPVLKISLLHSEDVQKTNLQIEAFADII